MFTRTIAGCLLAVLTCASPVAALTQRNVVKSIEPRQAHLARLAAKRGMTSAKPSALPMRPLPQ